MKVLTESIGSSNESEKKEENTHGTSWLRSDRCCRLADGSVAEEEAREHQMYGEQVLGRRYVRQAHLPSTSFLMAIGTLMFDRFEIPATYVDTYCIPSVREFHSSTCIFRRHITLHNTVLPI